MYVMSIFFMKFTVGSAVGEEGSIVGDLVGPPVGGGVVLI